MSYENDPMAQFEACASDLSENPGSRRAKHGYVLALARMGALEFAEVEYARLGLDQITDDEDIIALGGRLQKDHFQRSSGEEARAFSQKSADLYQQAYEYSGGYFSGINAATMGLLAGQDEDHIGSLARRVIEALPATSDTLDQAYYIKATRAEGLLLLGQTEKAQAAFRDALDHDPVNYLAHASTLRQFQMVLAARGEDASWLKSMRPPRPIHYAGSMRPQGITHERLKIQISDLIQRHDIGFAYGALSAGADILIAEALLEEGVDLYVILPDKEAAFIEVSVHPYGEDWGPRFEACLTAAKRVSIAPRLEASTGPSQIDLAARMAMGQALMRANQLQRNPLQLLLHNQNRTGSMTARHMSDWEAVGHSRLIVDVESEGPPSRGMVPAGTPTYVMRRRSGPELTRHTSLEEALSHAALRPLDAYDIHFDTETVADVFSAMNEILLPETILVTEAVASYASLSESMSQQFIFAGSLERQSKNSLRCFTVSPHHS